MLITRDICEMIQARASSGRAASKICDTLFASIIAILQQRFDIAYLHAELLLADVIREHEEVRRAGPPLPVTQRPLSPETGPTQIARCSAWSVLTTTSTCASGGAGSR